MVGYHAAMNHFLRCHFYADRTRYVEAAGASDWYRETSSHYVPKVRSECRGRGERSYQGRKIRSTQFDSSLQSAGVSTVRDLPGPSRDFLVGHDHVAVVEPHPR